ncbi:MAG: hypothetical protein ACQET5_13265 [Halobacteriota archaeon]|uniref:hypothetical protein n=1 Tax=Natronomonas sp. TaxID=2184060 RepID=UPI0039748869
MDDSASLSTMRLYGATIAIVSGLYSAYLSVSGTQMSTGAWFMLALGVVVVVHGIVLLTPMAARLGTLSGPLMLGYAGLMLLDQLRLSMNWTFAAINDGGMDGMGSGTGGMGMDGVGPSTEMAMMGADAGMIAIAVLMLASGLIMTVRRGMMPADG